MNRVGLAIALALLFACNSKSEERREPPKAGSNDAAGSGVGSDSEIVGGVTLKLLAAGAEPRKALRFKLGRGDKAKAEIRMAMDVRVSADGEAKRAIKLPVATAIINLKMTSVEADVFAFDWVVLAYNAEDTPGVLPQVLSGFKAQVGQLVGAKGTGTIDPQGRNLGATFEMPPGAEPQAEQLMSGMRDAMATISAPLPTQAIGVGASWRVAQTTTQNGTKSNIEHTYTIEAMDGDTLTLAIQMKISGVPGPLRAPGPGESAHLDSMSGSGSGKIVVALTELVPTASDVLMTTTTHTTRTTPSKTEKVASDLSVTIGIKAIR